jgi:hypothetical protein
VAADVRGICSGSVNFLLYKIALTFGQGDGGDGAATDDGEMG